MGKAKNISYVLIGQIVGTLGSFLLMPFLTRQFNYEIYGTYGQIILLSTFAEVVFSAGLPVTLYAFISKAASDSKESGKIFSSNFIPSVFLGLLAALIFFSFGGPLSNAFNNPLLAQPLRLYCWIFPLLIPAGILQNFLIFKNDVKRVVAINLAGNIMKLAISCLIIHFYPNNLLHLFEFLILYQFVIFAIYFIYTFKKYKIKLKANADMVFAQLKNGASLASVSIIAKLIFLTDSFLISKLLSTTDYAIYRSGAFEVPVLSTIYAAVSTIILPEIHKLWADQDLRQSIIPLKQKIVRYSMLINYPVLAYLILSSHDLITLYLSVKYSASAIVFSIFNLTLAIRVNDYEDVIIASKNGFKLVVYYLIGFVFNSLCAYFLILNYGYAGGATSIVLTILLIASLELRKSTRLLQCKLSDIFPIATMLKIIFITGSAAFSGYLIKENLLQEFRPITRLVIMTIFYFATTYTIIYINNTGNFHELKNIVLKITKLEKLFPIRQVEA